LVLLALTPKAAEIILRATASVVAGLSPPPPLSPAAAAAGAVAGALVSRGDAIEDTEDEFLVCVCMKGVVGVGGGGSGWFDSSSEEDEMEASSQESRVLGLRFGLWEGFSPVEVEVEVRVRYERVVGRSSGEDLLIVR